MNGDIIACELLNSMACYFLMGNVTSFMESLEAMIFG